MNDTVTVMAGQTAVPLSHPRKVLFPEAGVTKADLAEYYLAVAETLLPHVHGRPIALERYPDGISGTRIFQKRVAGYFPEWVDRVTVEKAGGSLTQVVCDNAATLAYLADLACITPHAWLSRVDRLERPDELVFDLDPPDCGFAVARAAALAVRSLLEELGLPSFVKTTGKRGVHVVVPLDRGADYDAVRSFARDVARVLVERHPSELTLEVRKQRRHGLLYLDVMRNAYAQMAVAPYAVRATALATVATPLTWEELCDPSLVPSRLTLRTTVDRLAATRDPWEAMPRKARGLGEARETLRLMRAT